MENHMDQSGLSEHEKAQEKLYLIWRSGVLQGQDAFITAWARSLERLATEAECAYIHWLFKTHPPLNDPHNTLSLLM